jgi:hypothetical protein
VEATNEPEKTLMGESRAGRSIGKGSICRLENLEEAANRLSVVLGDLGLAVYDLKKDGVYGTQIGEGSFLFLNTGQEPAEAQVSLGANKTRRIIVPVGGIARLDCE